MLNAILKWFLYLCIFDVIFVGVWCIIVEINERRR